MLSPRAGKHTGNIFSIGASAAPSCVPPTPGKSSMCQKKPLKPPKTQQNYRNYHVIIDSLQIYVYTLYFPIQNYIIKHLYGFNENSVCTILKLGHSPPPMGAQIHPAWIACLSTLWFSFPRFYLCWEKITPFTSSDIYGCVCMYIHYKKGRCYKKNWVQKRRK